MRSTRWTYLGLASALLALLIATPGGAAEHRLGGGIHYWRALDDFDDEGFDNLEESGVSYLASYQYVPRGLFRFEVDLEFFGDGFGGSESSAISPLGFVVLGKGLYAGLGVGVTYSDDFDGSFSDPFYAARLGFDVEVLPRLFIDIQANYQFDTFGELDSPDSDAITFGAIARFEL